MACHSGSVSVRGEVDVGADNRAVEEEQGGRGGTGRKRRSGEEDFPC